MICPHLCMCTLEKMGVNKTPRRHINTDQVSRTNTDDTPVICECIFWKKKTLAFINVSYFSAGGNKNKCLTVIIERQDWSLRACAALHILRLSTS